MRYLLSFLLLLALLVGRVQGAVVATTNMIVAGGDWTDFTNKAQRATAGQWVIVPPGLTMHVPTNQLNLLRPGVNYEIYPDLVFGTEGDTVTRPIFAEQQASTNILIFHGNVTVSNQASRLINFSNAATRITLIHHKQIHQAATNGQQPIIFMVNGVLSVKGQSWRNNRYDGIWTFGPNVRYDVTLDEWVGNDTAVENSAEITTGLGVARIGNIEKLSTGPLSTGEGVTVALYGKSYLYAGTINLHSNNHVFLNGSAATNRSFLSVGRLVNDVGSTRELVNAEGYAEIADSSLEPNSIVTPVIINSSDNVVFRNVAITQPAGATNSVESQVNTIRVAGTLTMNKPPDTSLWVTMFSEGVVIVTNLTTVNGRLALGSASVSLAADNQSVSTLAVSYIRLDSNNGTAGNRTFVLNQGATGQQLIIEWVGTNAGELVDDSAQTGAGNHRLNGTWTPTQYDVLSLVFNGTDWVERSRSTN